eukprot:IDg10877t1
MGTTSTSFTTCSPANTPSNDWDRPPTSSTGKWSGSTKE